MKNYFNVGTTLLTTNVVNQQCISYKKTLEFNKA